MTGAEHDAQTARRLADLRHLYQQMLDGQVKDTAEAARGLLGPAIEELERLATAGGPILMRDLHARLNERDELRRQLEALRAVVGFFVKVVGDLGVGAKEK